MWRLELARRDAYESRTSSPARCNWESGWSLTVRWAIPDTNAVAVLRALDGKKLGYLPAHIAPRVAAVFDQVGVELSAIVTDLIDKDRTDVPPAVYVSFDLPTFDVP